MTEQLEEFKALLKPFMRLKALISMARQRGMPIDPQRIAAHDELGTAIIRFPADDRDVARIKTVLFHKGSLPIDSDRAFQEFSISLDGAGSFRMTKGETDEVRLWLEQLAASPCDLTVKAEGAAK